MTEPGRRLERPAVRRPPTTPTMTPTTRRRRAIQKSRLPKMFSPSCRSCEKVVVVIVRRSCPSRRTRLAVAVLEREVDRAHQRDQQAAGDEDSAGVTKIHARERCSIAPPLVAVGRVGGRADATPRASGTTVAISASTEVAVTDVGAAPGADEPADGAPVPRRRARLAVIAPERQRPISPNAATTAVQTQQLAPVEAGWYAVVEATARSSRGRPAPAGSRHRVGGRAGTSRPVARRRRSALSSEQHGRRRRHAADRTRPQPTVRRSSSRSAGCRRATKKPRKPTAKPTIVLNTSTGRRPGRTACWRRPRAPPRCRRRRRP